MSDREISDLLARAGDDQDRPLRTDPGELLDRARRDLGRRRRVNGALATLAAAAVVAGVVVVPRLVSGPTTPVAPRPTTSPVLSAATVVERCRPQLAKYAGVSGYDADPTTADWHLSHQGRRYRAGDLVQLTSAGGDVGRPVLCVVPVKGHEQDPVGFARLTPVAGDPDLLRAVCAEQATEVGDGGVRIPDLRRASVLASGFAGRLGGALLQGPDGHLYGCATAPPTRGDEIADVERADDSVVFTTLGTAYAVFAGKVDAEARTLELSGPGIPTRTYPVESRYVVAVARWDAGPSRTITWRELAADGRVVSLGTAD